ncbi:MAG: hypothetical protein ABI537_16720 [Casimicrobiaceae bacterium]
MPPAPRRPPPWWYTSSTGRLDIVAPVALVIGAKLVIDLAFHLWSVHLFRHWLGDAQRASLGWAFVAALDEPFTFQLLRRTGAARRWGRQARFGFDA